MYYIPGALAGAASVMVWLFVLDPSVSPVSFLLSAFGFDTFIVFLFAQRFLVAGMLSGAVKD